MAELAQVIVDVPTLQTNRPYTYQVPPKLEHQIQVGMRVIVPFGKGKRSVQGFVVGLDQPADFHGTLKQITASRSNLLVLDFVFIYDASKHAQG